jgi:hypothetical protein
MSKLSDEKIRAAVYASHVDITLSDAIALTRAIEAAVLEAQKQKQEPWPFSADRMTYHKAAPVVQPDPVLCNFYQVETFPDLVAALVHHIEKLQAKVPPFGNNWPGKVREG